MSTQQDVIALRALLFTNPDELLARIEQELTEAQSRQDIARVRNLVAAIEPFIATNPYVAQWHQYALGYLCQQADHNAIDAIAHLETLRNQIDALYPSLPKRILNGLGILYEMEQRWDLASQRYLECIAIATQEEDYLYLGKVFSNLTILHTQTGDYESAIAFAKRSIEHLSRKPDDVDWQISLGGAWNQIGIAYRDWGKFDEARKAFEGYLAILQRWNAHDRLCIAYNNLASLYIKLGESQRAQQLYEQALDAAIAAENQQEQAEAYLGLGQLGSNASAPAEPSMQLLDLALALADNANHYELITHTRLRRATLYEAGEQLPAAREELRTAIRTIESLRANIVIPEDRLRWQSTWITAYERLVKLLIREERGFTEAFAYTEMAKSRVMVELLASRSVRTPKHLPPTLLAEERALRDQLSSLYAESTASEQIRIAEAQLSSIREQIRRVAPDFDTFFDSTPLTLDQVMTQLPTASLLLEYFTCGDIIVAFVITESQVQVIRLPITVSQLRRAFASNQNEPFVLRNLIPDSYGQLAQPWILRQLGDALVGPLQEALQSASTLYIVPHDILHYIPFHALHLTTGNGAPLYLADMGRQPKQIIYAPSATVLFKHCHHKQPSQNNGGLAIGYNDTFLTQAETEALAVAAVTHGNALTGNHATKAALVELGHHYRYIHIACHGQYNVAWPLASSLTLADGSLAVLDILQDLHLEAELVTLSACDSGRSQVMRGDELVGLTSAFLYVGTPSVLVSHWIVDDFATRLFMERFYIELAECSENAALALVRTQRSIRNLTYQELQQMNKAGPAPHWENKEPSFKDTDCPFAHPYYWASFFLVGARLANKDR